MNKLEEICQKFILLKTKLTPSDINFLCKHSFRSIAGGIKGFYKDQENAREENLNNKRNEIEIQKKNNISNSNTKKHIKNECYKNLIITLQSSTKKNKENKNKDKKSYNIPSPSNKNINDNSPTIMNEEENEANLKKEELNLKSNDNRIIPLNEDEENDKQNIESNISDNKTNSKVKKRINNLINTSVNIIDKNNKNYNLKDKLIEIISTFGTYLSKFTNLNPKMKSIENFYEEQKNKLLSFNLLDNNMISIDTVKKCIHLLYNILSKIFNVLTKETENACKKFLTNLFDILHLIIDFIKNLKIFIKNNNENIDITFLRNIKVIGQYFIYSLSINKYNYEYMANIQRKGENDKIQIFFYNYMKYLKTIEKLKIIFKDNELFIKHFIILPNMVSCIDLFEMNRKIINYQLNVNLK